MVRMAQRLVVTLVLAMALVLPATAQTVPTPSPATKQRAKQHFLSGVERFDEGDYDGALAEFLASRKLFATPSATKNAAISYRLLRRYAAAVDLFETLLAEFPALGDADRKLAQRELLELAPRVGQIVISCSELDAQLSLDGRDRGSLDATKAIRVSIGSHTIRISKSGFEPYQTRVDVAGAQKSEVRVELEPLASSGVLSVSEALGRPFVVVIDGTAVGKTPWRGSFAPGNHTILLRGDDNMGTPPSQVEVRVDEVTSVSLAAKKLLAHLRVEPTPASAVVFVDGVNVGSGFFEGRLLGGEHRVRVEAPGFVPLSERVMIADNASETVVATLSADPTQSTRA